MVLFTKKGLEKLIDCAMNRSQVAISGDVIGHIAELSIILTKISFILDKNLDNLLTFNDGIYYLGTGPQTKIDATQLFTYFGISQVVDQIPDGAINTRNTGLCYSIELGEAMLLNNTFNTYTFNDGSTIPAGKFATINIIPLKKDTMIRFMPILYKEMKKAEKVFNTKLTELGLSGIVEGSRVQIRTYAELVTKFGEQMLVMGEDDNVVLVENSEDPDAVRFIKHLGYSKLSADYYDNKFGVIDHIDMLTGHLILSIDGKKQHTMFMDEGVAQSNSGEAIIFTIEHIKKA